MFVEQQYSDFQRLKKRAFCFKNMSFYVTVHWIKTDKIVKSSLYTATSPIFDPVHMLKKHISPPPFGRNSNLNFEPTTTAANAVPWDFHRAASPIHNY